MSPTWWTAARASCVAQPRRTKAGISALDVPKLKIVFITHLHSDHTLGYPDLIFSPWVMERTEPLTAYGPRGRRAMTAHIEKAWQEDIRVRTQGPEKAN